MRLKWMGTLALLTLLAAGCGEQKPGLSPVHGRVFFRSAPLAGGVIVFTPDLEHGNRGPQAWAHIGPDGAYVLSTGTDPGAISGWHRVTFKAAGTGAADILPPRYSDPDQSDQAREVKAGLGNEIDFHLE